MEIPYRSLLPRRLRRWLRSLVVECGMPACRGFHLSHPWLPRLPGIFLDRTWYCSPDCLQDALKRHVEVQLGAAITDLHLAPRMPYRLVLLAGGKVSEQQLSHARSVQASGTGGIDMGEALVSLGYAAEDEVAVARAVEAGCLFFGGMAQAVIPAYTLPLSLMRLHRAAVVHYSPATKRLLVGFVYRIDHALLQAVAQVTGCRTEACIITASAWSESLASQTAAFEEVHEAAFSQIRIVNMIVKQAIGCGADKVSVGLSATAVWARLAAGAGGLDLVIDLAAEAARSAGQMEEEVRRETDREDSRAAPAAAIRTPVSRRETEFPVLKRRNRAL